MNTLTSEMRQAIEDSAVQPPRFLDEATNITYVLLNSEIYDRIRCLIEANDGIQPTEMMSAMWQVMKGDWDDPDMDEYDTYPEA